jgi:pilus assembly protein FimV
VPQRPRLVLAVLIAASLGAAGTALAARLGPITVLSTAGQPLRAVIALEDGTSAAWSRSQVGLGSPDTYRDLGVEYPTALEGATAALARLPDGRYQVVVTGVRPIADPNTVPVVVTLRTPSGLHTRSYRPGGDERAGAPAGQVASPPGALAADPAPQSAPTVSAATSPAATSPAATSPAATSPAATSLAATSPAATSLAATSPAAGAPAAMAIAGAGATASAGTTGEPRAFSAPVRAPVPPASAGQPGIGEATVAAGALGSDEAARAAALAARMERVAASVEPVADTVRLPWPRETVRLPGVAEVPAADAPAPVARPLPPQVAGGVAQSGRAVGAEQVARPAPERAAGSEQIARPAPVRAASGAAGATGAARPTDGRTVSVAPGETATSIARRIKPDDVSDEQAVMALYRSNEQVFRGSVHRLPAGAVLVIPDADQVRSLPLAQAREALRAQPLPPPQRVAVATGGGGDRLTLSAGGSGRGTAPDASGGSGERERIAHEAAMSEAKSRIDQLESIVSDLKRLIALREQQIAALTREVAAAGAGASVPSPDGRLVPVGAAAATMIRSESRAVAPAPVAPPSQPAPPSLLWSGLVGGLAIAAGGAFWFVRRRRR